MFCAVPIGGAATAMPTVGAVSLTADERAALAMDSAPRRARVDPGSLFGGISLGGCDDDRGCGEGFVCVAVSVPPDGLPGSPTRRFACAPVTEAGPFACARAGMVTDPTTGTCVPAVVASEGAACGASMPDVVCAASGRCVRAAGATDGTCVAAADDGEPCFAIGTAGPGCMPPAICVRAADVGTGRCEIPVPSACRAPSAS
jgi:hypothetical protein